MKTEILEIKEIDFLFILLYVLGFESLVALAHRVQINVNGLMPVHDRIFRKRIGLVKIIRVIHESTPYVIKDYWSIWPQ